MPVNGFDKTEPVTFGDDGITIHVNAGRPILESVELPHVLAELIQERTGSLPIVRLADSGKVRTEEEFEQYLQEKVPAVKFEAKGDAARHDRGLALTNKPVKLFYGKDLQACRHPPSGTIWAMAVRSSLGRCLRHRGQGQPPQNLLYSITDYSGSVNRVLRRGRRICPSGRTPSPAPP